MGSCAAFPKLSNWWCRTNLRWATCSETSPFWDSEPCSDGGTTCGWWWDHSGPGGAPGICLPYRAGVHQFNSLRSSQQPEAEGMDSALGNQDVNWIQKKIFHSVTSAQLKFSNVLQTWKVFWNLTAKLSLKFQVRCTKFVLLSSLVADPGLAYFLVQPQREKRRICYRGKRTVRHITRPLA